MNEKPCATCGDTKPLDDYREGEHCCVECHRAIGRDLHIRYGDRIRARQQSPEAKETRKKYQSRPEVIQRRRYLDRERKRKKAKEIFAGPDEY